MSVIVKKQILRVFNFNADLKTKWVGKVGGGGVGRWGGANFGGKMDGGRGDWW